MDFLQAIIMGIVQGVTEFLPISSSGHLALVGNLMGVNMESYAFLTALLHVGTLVAVFIAFRKTIWKLILALIELIKKIFTGKFSFKQATASERMLIFLVVSCLPLIIALFIKDSIERMANYTWMVGIALIINGIVLFVSDHVPPSDKKAGRMTFGDAIRIGLAQLVAVTPGISRSGSTITMGVACGLDRAYAAKYSFILSIPAILAGAAVSFKDALSDGSLVASSIPAYLVGMVIAGVVGFLAIKLLEYLLRSKKFYIFAIYSIVVGVAAIILNFVI